MGRDPEQGGSKVPANLPPGLRLAVGFLDFISILTLLPICVTGFMAVLMLSAARHKPQEGWIALGSTGSLMILFLVFISLLVGSMWLAASIRSRAVIDAYHVEAPKGLAQTVGIPILVLLTIYSTFAVIAGLGMRIYLGESSIQWIVIWLLVALGAVVALRKLM